MFAEIENVRRELYARRDTFECSIEDPLDPTTCLPLSDRWWGTAPKSAPSSLAGDGFCTPWRVRDLRCASSSALVWGCRGFSSGTGYVRPGLDDS
jgi:hypothetical protein